LLVHCKTTIIDATTLWDPQDASTPTPTLVNPPHNFCQCHLLITLDM